jgi:hypothetical protein
VSIPQVLNPVIEVGISTNLLVNFVEVFVNKGMNTKQQVKQSKQIMNRMLTRQQTVALWTQEGIATHGKCVLCGKTDVLNHQTICVNQFTGAF